MILSGSRHSESLFNVMKSSNKFSKSNRGVPNQPSFSLANLARRKVEDGSIMACNLMRAAERAISAGADLFRSAAYLVASPDSGAVPVLKDTTGARQRCLQIDLREWFSNQTLQEKLPWAEPTIQLSFKPSAKRETTLFTVRATRNRSNTATGCVWVDLQTATTPTCSVKLSADHTSQLASCPRVDLKCEEVAYRVRLDSE
jgi:hypothetical protein